MAAPRILWPVGARRTTVEAEAAAEAEPDDPHATGDRLVAMQRLERDDTVGHGSRPVGAGEQAEGRLQGVRPLVHAGDAEAPEDLGREPDVALVGEVPEPGARCSC